MPGRISYLSTAMCPTSYIASHLCVAPRAAAAGAAYPALAAGAGRASPAAPRGTSAAAAVEGAAATRVGWRRWRWRGGRERVEIGSSDGAATGVGLPEMGPRETLRHHFDSSGTLTGPWKGGRAAG